MKSIESRLSKLELRTVSESGPLPIETVIREADNPEFMERHKDNLTVKYLKSFEGEEF